MLNFSAGNMQLSTVLLSLLFTVLLGLFIFFVYRQVNKNSFYNKSFNISLVGLSVIIAAIILTIQSNVIVSLGMVGALSIVRFRTAIKDPMDLLFLFWAIAVGIICGAGFALIAAITSLLFAAVLMGFHLLPVGHSTEMLVINAQEATDEETIMEVVNRFCQNPKIRSHSLSAAGRNLAIQVYVTDSSALLRELMALEGVTFASLVEHDGNITA